MKSFRAFLQKEIIAQLRSGKLWILIGLFVLLGIFNPIVTLLTPWLMEMMAETLAESGMNISVTDTGAVDSWMQFFKNLPMWLMGFVLLEGNLFTKEYSAGTLVLALTKGLPRHRVVVSKAVVMLCLWTACYWLSFGITYAGNAYFWGNDGACNLAFAAFCWWLFGLLVISLAVLLSTVVSGYGGVLCGVGGTVMAIYMLSLLPFVSEYLPTFLMDGSSLLLGLHHAGEYVAALLITTAASVSCLVISVLAFDKKQL